MFVQTSRPFRRISGRLDQGESISDAVLQLVVDCDVRAARFHARGFISEAVVVPIDTERRTFSPQRVLKGNLQVLSLDGVLLVRGDSVSAQFIACVLDEGSPTLEIITGILMSARAQSLEYEVESWDGLISEATPGKAAEAAVPQAEPARAVVAPLPRSIVEAAKMLDAMPPRHEETTVAPSDPEPGDLLEHPSFGTVEVQSEVEGGRLRIRLPNGSHREIMLEVFEVVLREERDGKRRFLLRARRR